MLEARSADYTERVAQKYETCWSVEQAKVAWGSYLRSSETYRARLLLEDEQLLQCLGEVSGLKFINERLCRAEEGRLTQYAQRRSRAEKLGTVSGGACAQGDSTLASASISGNWASTIALQSFSIF